MKLSLPLLSNQNEFNDKDKKNEMVRFNKITDIWIVYQGLQSFSPIMYAESE